MYIRLIYSNLIWFLFSQVDWVTALHNLTKSSDWCDAYSCFQTLACTHAVKSYFEFFSLLAILYIPCVYSSRQAWWLRASTSDMSSICMGVLVNSDLTWQKQIQSVHRKRLAALPAIKGVRAYLPIKILVSLYNAFVQPCILFTFAQNLCQTAFREFSKTLLPAQVCS